MVYVSSLCVINTAVQFSPMLNIWSWKDMEFRKTIFQTWKVMENSKGHGMSWKVMEKDD